MHDAVGDADCLWSYKIGSGYSWMVSEGVPAIDSAVTENSAVVILLGVNDVIDPFLLYQYADYLNAKAAEWKKRGAETFYASIMPVDDALDHYEHNADIEYWNDTIQPLLSGDVIYLDLFHPMLGQFQTVDGLHYTYDTYRMIFDLILAGVDLYQSAVIKFEPQEIPPDDATVPQMNFTAADTENAYDEASANDRWTVIAGKVRYVGDDGKLAEGLRIIDDYVCYFDRYGNLVWQVRK